MGETDVRPLLGGHAASIMTPGWARSFRSHWYCEVLALLLLGCLSPVSTSKDPPGEDARFLSPYHNYSRTLTLIDSLEQRCGEIIQKKVYGRSLAGRELIGVKISGNVSINEAKPQVSLDGATHGEEWISSEMVIRLMRELCHSYGTDSALTRLVDSREIFIYPFINPDGWEAARRFNNNHVDINRDYGYMWGGGGNSHAPWSQPESRAVWNWINENHFVFSIHLHAGIEALYYPWGHKSGNTPDARHYAYLMQQYYESSGYGHLDIGSAHEAMYPTKGTFYDFIYGTRGTLAWLMEVSAASRVGEPDLSRYYEMNRPAFIEMLELAGRGIHGKVTDAVSGQPVPAIIWVSDDDTEYWPIYSCPEVGDYQKFVRPGVYTVRATANGFSSTTSYNVNVGDGQATVQDFTLTAAEEPVFGFRIEMATLNDADETMTFWALGAPDNESYSLGVGGSVVIDMGETLGTGPGIDLRVVQGSPSPKGFAVAVGVTLFGPMIRVGAGQGTTSFDLAEVGISAYRYVRITDVGDVGNKMGNAGFDLDAVEGYTGGPGTPRKTPLET